MILIINTTDDRDISEKIRSELRSTSTDFDIVEASEMKIGNCIGCNYCWLKTPGICTVKDDHETILRKMVKSEQIWIISDVTLDFVTPLAKNIVDRTIPLATMNLKFKGDQMRHVLRYGKKGYDFGLIIRGEADMDYLKRWSERVAVNFGGRSRGAFGTEDIKEAVSCM